MPGTFTRAFAERLDRECKIKVKEAENLEQLRPGTAYVAPGGQQTRIGFDGRDHFLAVEDLDSCSLYKPSIDVTLTSMAPGAKVPLARSTVGGMR